MTLRIQNHLARTFQVGSLWARAHKKATQALPFVIVVALSSCDGNAQNSAVFECPPKNVKLPAPWVYRERAERPSLIYAGRHFSVPFGAIGIDVGTQLEADRANAFVGLRRCVPENDPAFAVTPCGNMRLLEQVTKPNNNYGFNNVLFHIGGMNVGDRYIHPPDRSFVGICDGVDFPSLKSSFDSVCRIWLPNQERTRGLYIVLPGQAFLEIPNLVSKAKAFLDDKYLSCVR